MSPDLLKGSLQRYEDPEGAYSLLVPFLWPLVERNPESGTTSFTEIGGNGYLNLFAQPGATGFSAEQIVAAWKEQWSEEDGFQLIQDVTPKRVAGRDGAELVYQWRPDQEREWTRRLQATVIGDTFYAVALDYPSSGYEERLTTFRDIFSSFSVKDEQDMMPDVSETQTPTQESTQTPSIPEANSTPDEPQERITSSEQLIPDPLSEGHTLLLGRLLTRYPGESGREIEEPAKQVRVYVTTGGVETLTESTDSDGFVFLPNLPPLEDGNEYRITRIEGRVFGFTQDVAVTFENLTQEVGKEGLVNIGTVILTLDASRSITVEVERGLSVVTGRTSPLERFISTYPSTAWSQRVQRAIDHETN